ncbi:LysM peptidoglycan-binding domain-containing protein [Deinococcus rubellus]|uniref:BON domain-containing protein n=1 Tax=Deinococcus rubellus TaxID=1889240 RepID=A0ABY5YJW3_9DEIO|nr:BON domain-containing protein [Deinococcus rubellus]UWX65098.1 BON domain-containing protein [Deinococcus rubellus]
MWPFGKSTADRVKEALNAQPQLKDLGLQVSESGGNVTVAGMVPNDRYGQLVTVIAEGINGVKNVDISGLVAQAPAEVQVSAPTPSVEVGGSQDDASSVTETGSQGGSVMQSDPVPSPASTSADDAIAQAVESSKIAKAVYHAIRSNGELADDPIDVLQSGKSVILRGAVDSDHEQRLAEQVARGVAGVAGVDVSGLKVVAQAKEMHKDRDEKSGDATYTIKSGDTLSAIAEKYFGDAMRYKDIAHFNNISDPDAIQAGQVIKIPSA